ncbi:hypothetical protein IPH25_04910 [bacterium]|nr:MAG: hypothetical protein IPG37_01915 [bacterium]QQR61779.1 MAG: hypothetical protein IPH25_04910 [bacterium]QQR62643.1 MAG: hypothetical protein IPH67_04480 [bacterium]
MWYCRYRKDQLDFTYEKVFFVVAVLHQLCFFIFFFIRDASLKRMVFHIEAKSMQLFEKDIVLIDDFIDANSVSLPVVSGSVIVESVHKKPALAVSGLKGTVAKKQSAVQVKKTTQKKKAPVKTKHTNSKIGKSLAKNEVKKTVLVDKKIKTALSSSALKAQKSPEKSIQGQKVVSSEDISKATSATENQNYSHQQLVDQQEQLLRSEYIKNELKRVWNPPVITMNGSECVFTVEVDYSGAVKHVVMEKSSGILMYDVMAQQAVHGIKMPLWAYNTIMTIVLKV